MKRNIVKISLSLVLVFVLCGTVIDSCKRSNLDLFPHGPTEQSYFTTEAEFNRTVLGVYAKMSDFFWFNTGPGNTTITMFVLPGDDVTTNQSGEEFEIFGSIQPGSGRVRYLYTALYQMINRANLVLQKI